MNPQVLVLLDDDFDENEIFSHVLSRLDMHPFYQYFSSWADLLQYLKDFPEYRPSYLFIDAYVGKTMSETFIPTLRRLAQVIDSKIVVYSTIDPLPSLLTVMKDNNCKFLSQSSSIGQYTESIASILRADDL